VFFGLEIEAYQGFVRPDLYGVSNVVKAMDCYLRGSFGSIERLGTGLDCFGGGRGVFFFFRIWGFFL